MANRYEQIIANVQSMVNQNAPANDIDGYLAYEGITPAQFKKLVEGPTLGGQLKEFFKGIPSGAIGLGETAGVGAAALLPEEYETPTRKFIQEKAAALQKPFAPEIGYEDTVGREFGQAVGSTVPFFALGPLGTAGRVISGATAGAAGAGEARMEAERQGATGSDRAIATLLGTPVGLLDLVAPELEFGKSFITRAAVTGGIEGATEAAQKVSQNMIAKGIYNPDQPILAGAGEEGAYGAGAGALSRFLLDMALGRKAHAGAGTQPPAATPVGLPATARQQDMFGESTEGFRAPLPPYREAEEKEAGVQNRLFQITEMRDQHDVLMREIDRLKTQFEAPGATEEQKQSILEQADQLNTARADLEKQIKKLSKGLEGVERAGAAPEPGQTTLDFEAPAMPRQKTGEGMVLGEQPTPTGATPEQIEFFRQQRIKSIQDRLAAGEMVTPAEQAFLRMDEREQRALFEAQPTPELALPEERPEFRLGPQYLQPTPVETTAVETRPVTESDFKKMGIGVTNKKLREAILGKDLTDPAQRDEVKEVLTDYANNPNRSAKVIDGVNSFLSSPAFMEQGALDFGKPKRTRAKKAKEATNVIEPTESVEPASESGAGVAEQRGEAPAGGVEAPQAGGVDVTGRAVEQPAAGEAVQPATLTEAQNAPAATSTTAVEPVSAPAAPAVGATATTVSPTATETTEGQTAPTAPARVDLRTAIDRLIFEANLKRVDATRLARDLADGYDEVGSQDITDVVKTLKGGKPLYRAGKGGKGSVAAKVQKVVDNITSRWKNAPNITVVQSVTDLPEHLQRSIAQDKTNPPGLFDPSTEQIYLVADNITSDVDAALTLAHEAVGHYGLRSILGTSYAKTMDDIYNGNAAVRKAAQEKMQQGVDKQTAVEEVLAEMAEGGKQNNAIQRAMNAIRQWLRSVGIPFQKVTDAEVRELLANARRFVVEGGTKAKGAPAEGKALYRTKKEEPLTAEGQRAAALNERMKGIANEPEPDVDQTLRQRVTLLADKFKDLPMKFRQSVVDKDAPVKEKIAGEFRNKVTNDLGEVSGIVLNEQAQEAAGLADQLMQKGGIRVGKDGLLEVYDNFDEETGEKISLDQVFKTVIEDLGAKLGSAKEAVTLAHRAFIAQRASEINKRNELKRKQIEAAEAKGNKRAADMLRKEIINVRASQAEIDAGLEAMRTFPELQKAFDTFTKYNEGITDFLVATGRISPAEAQDWKDNVGYVPWTRVEEEDNKLTEMGKLRTGNVHLSSLPTLDKEGSSKEIRNVLDNMVGHTIWAIRSGTKNRAAITMLEQLPDAEELKTQDDVDRELKNNKPLVVFAYRGGERVAFRLQNQEDLAAFSNIVDVAGPILGAFKTAATGLRSFVTHMPTFALSQLSQDTVRAMFLSGVKHPFSLPAKVMSNFYHAVTGGTTDLQSLGITGTYEGMPEHVMQRVRERHGLQDRSLRRRLWDKLEDFSLAADMAVRAAIYEQTLKETGDRVLAFHRAKEYINFKTSGNGQAVRILRQIVPFMNAYIQGMDVLYRTLQGKGLSMEDRRVALGLFLTTGMKVAALSMLYSMLVGDDDDYKGLDDYERDNNFIIPGLKMKIPVAPEIGFMFKVIPERIYQAISREGTDRPVDATTFMRGMRDAAINAYGGINIMPQLVKPAIEVATNHSFFTGNPIVGINMAGKETAQQFNDHTSELAKLFGYVGISPMKVDHLVRGYLGTVGGVVLDVTDAVADPNRMSKPLNKMPLVKTFMYDDTGRGYKTEFYAFREDVDKVVNSVNAFKREGRAEELQSYLTEDKLKLYAMSGVVNKIEETLSKLRQYRSIIANDPDLTPQEKREKTDAVVQQEKEILQAYNIPRLKQMAGM